MQQSFHIFESVLLLEDDPAHAMLIKRTLAEFAVHNLQDGPELTSGLRKLLEAKDAGVRAALYRDPS